MRARRAALVSRYGSGWTSGGSGRERSRATRTCLRCCDKEQRRRKWAGTGLRTPSVSMAEKCGRRRAVVATWEGLAGTRGEVVEAVSR
jgi:hypothetical protein